MSHKNGTEKLASLNVTHVVEYCHDCSIKKNISLNLELSEQVMDAFWHTGHMYKSVARGRKNPHTTKMYTF